MTINIMAKCYGLDSPTLLVNVIATVLLLMDDNL